MTLRIVVVGTGFGKHRVAPAYRGLGRDLHIDIVSPHDMDAVNAAIEAPCDLVSIHSPPFLHLEHVRLATRYDRNVLCDKPFGGNAADARAMRDLATQAGVLHFLNFEFRSDPLRLKLKDMLDQETLGKPVHVTVSTFISWGRNLRHRWLFEAGKGGWVGASGAHTIDMLRWMFGEVVAATGQRRTEVTARPDRERGRELMHPSTAEDAFTAVLRMDSGVTATIDSAYAAAVTLPSQITIFCSEGVYQISSQSELCLLRPGQDPERLTFPVDAVDPHQPALGLWLAKVCDAVAAGRQIGPDFNAGLACVEVLDRLRATELARRQDDSEHAR